MTVMRFFRNIGTSFLQFTGSGRTWLDFNFGIGALERGVAPPDLISLKDSDIKTLGFDGVNTLEQVSTVLELNHNWAEGTAIYAHVHWYPTTADTGSVVWQLEYAIVPFKGAVPSSTTITVTQAAGGVAWADLLAEFAAINAPAITIGAQMFIRLFRDPTHGSDDYAADAALGTFGLHVLVDSLGSRERLSK